MAKTTKTAVRSTAAKKAAKKATTKTTAKKAAKPTEPVPLNDGGATAAASAPAPAEPVTASAPGVERAPIATEGSQPVEVAAPPVVSATPNAQLQYETVPLDMPRKQAASYEPAGIHPDVTQMGPPDPKLTDGRAKHEDLAPGQSLAPSPPISSSNILPQPEKPSFG